MRKLPFNWLAANIPLAINKRQRDPKGTVNNEQPRDTDNIGGKTQDTDNHTKRTKQNAKMMTNATPPHTPTHPRTPKVNPGAARIINRYTYSI